MVRNDPDASGTTVNSTDNCSVYVYVSKMTYRNPGILSNTYSNSPFQWKKPLLHLGQHFCSTSVILVSLRKRRVTHGYTTTHTNDPISPVKAAQTEIAPVLMCVSQSSIIQLCLFQMLSTKRCTDTLTVCTANRDIN